MKWARILGYITRTVDQELLLRNEYLAAENRILMAKLNGRPRFSDVERATLGEIGFRLGRRALSEVATAAQPDTTLAWYRPLVARKFDGSPARRARIILLAADGRSTRSVARTVGTMPRTVSLWRGRFARDGLAGLTDKPRPGPTPSMGLRAADVFWRCWTDRLRPDFRAGLDR